jgi:Fe-S oxidoreductase
MGTSTKPTPPASKHHYKPAGNVEEELAAALDDILTNCTQCGACRRDCLFLQRHALPFELAEAFTKGTLDAMAPFRCSLCRLCTAVCPEKLDPSRLIWHMRCYFMQQGAVSIRPYRQLLAYERLGGSRLFGLFQLPAGCDTVFFPGCALAGAYPHALLHAISALRQRVANLGIILSCCAKPSHDLGRMDYFSAVMDELLDSFRRRRIQTLITACPSCHQVFSDYGSTLTVRSIYEYLSTPTGDEPATTLTNLAIHDPCATRFHPDIQRGVRSVLYNRSCTVRELNHRQEKTFCCGEGGAVGFIDSSYQKMWAEKRCGETGNEPLVTYCAGCVQTLSPRRPVHHVLELLFGPRNTKKKPARPPITYLNRLWVKWKIKNMNII